MCVTNLKKLLTNCIKYLSMFLIHNSWLKLETRILLFFYFNKHINYYQLFLIKKLLFFPIIYMNIMYLFFS